MSDGTTLADDRPVDPDDELLVAYLDGELDLGARDEVEQRLVDEISLRKRLQTLQASWDFLDVLPETGSNDKLVESTLELVVADIVQKAPSQAMEAQRPRWPWGAVLLCFVAAVSAFAVVSANHSSRLRQEMADLSLAENMDAYLYGADLDLMRQLESKKKWNAMIKAARDLGDLSLDAKAIIAETPVDQRPEKLAELSVEERAVLDSRWDRFQRFDERDRQTIRNSAAAVAEKSDAKSLLKTMQTYAVWRDTLSNELRDKIESENPEIRDLAIDEAIKKTLASITRTSGERLNIATSDLIFAAIGHFLDRRIAEDPSLGDDIEKLGQRIRNTDIARRLAMRMMLGIPFRPRGPGGGGRGPGGGEPGGGEPGGGEPGGGEPGDFFQSINVPKITSVELMSIIDVLSADSGDHSRALRNLATLDDAGTFSMQESLVEQTLLQWADEAIDRSRPSSVFERKSLLELYRELDPEDRDAIDMLPAEKFKEELQRLSDPRRGRGPFRLRSAPQR